MRRTLMTYFNPDLAPRSADLETRLVPHVELRLRWRVRSGRLISHWCVTRRYARDEGAEALVSETREVPFEDLVPGDIMRLSAGDIIPADIRPFRFTAGDLSP